MPEVRNNWTLERFKEQLSSVDNDIKQMNKEMNNTDSRITELQEKKKSLRIRISKKTKYKNILESHIRNDFWT